MSASRATSVAVPRAFAAMHTLGARFDQLLQG
jgi:hypothetical protein